MPARGRVALMLMMASAHGSTGEANFTLGVVRLGVLLPMVGKTPPYTVSGWWPRMGWFQALRELNNKTDG
eukprot:4635565-Prymnesium_polylepis.1